MKVKSLSPASSALSAAFRHFSRQLRGNALEADFQVGGGLDADHIAVVVGLLVLEPLWRVREQAAALV